MPLEIVHADMAELKADALVVEVTVGRGGPINQAADKVKDVFGLDTPLEAGMADIELAKSGPAKFNILAALPAWQGGDAGEMKLLGECCANAMNLARELGFRSVAFPLLGAGSGYPEEPALRMEKAVLDVALVNDNMRVIIALAPSGD